MVLVAALIVDCALQREESRGLHYTLDHLQKSETIADSCLRVD